MAFIVTSNAERQGRWRTKRDVDIETLRVASNKAELALAQAENYLLRQRVLDLETALARQECSPGECRQVCQDQGDQRNCPPQGEEQGAAIPTSSNVGLVQQRDRKRGRPDLQGKQSDREGAASRRHAKRGGQAGSVQGVLGVEE
jgi:hypothetical protein